MRVISRVRELVTELGWSAGDLGRALDIDPRSAQKLIDDTPTWELRRSTLHKLMLLGFEHDYELGLFEVRQHELWDTFDGARATLFRVNHVWDARAETTIRRFLAHLTCRPDLGDSQSSVAKIEHLVRSRNCIFVGSAKANPASEVALALLSGAKPFDSTATNRRKMLFQLLGKTEKHLSGESAVLASGSWCGIAVRAHDRAEPVRVRVDWLPDDKYWGRSAQEGQDAAAVVVCRNPLGSKADVTTIVISGYTGRATEEAAEELIRGEPPITVEQLATSGQPTTAIYTYKFKKRGYRGRKKVADLRSVVATSGQWRPPW